VVCNTGIRFDPVIQTDEPLRFDFYGLYNGVLAMIDHQTGSVWLQVSGKAVKGPQVGKTLKTGPLLDTTWKRWKQLHPDTSVMAPMPAFREFYDPKGVIVERGFDHFPNRYFRKSITHRDSRLPTHEMVMAVCAPKQSRDPLEAEVAASTRATATSYRAYPLKVFKGASGVLNDNLNGPSVAIFYEAKSATCAALSRQLDQTVLTFECRKLPDGTAAFCDRETGSRWTIEGEAVEGPLAGKKLQRLDGTMSQWYGWVAYFPQTSVYGHLNPQPVRAQ
jgi:Protein of unknown function (DUF3179)